MSANKRSETEVGRTQVNDHRARVRHAPRVVPSVYCRFETSSPDPRPPTPCEGASPKNALLLRSWVTFFVLYSDVCRRWCLEDLIQAAALAHAF